MEEQERKSGARERTGKSQDRIGAEAGALCAESLGSRTKNLLARGDRTRVEQSPQERKRRRRGRGSASSSGSRHDSDRALGWQGRGTADLGRQNEIERRCAGRVA